MADLIAVYKDDDTSPPPLVIQNILCMSAAIVLQWGIRLESAPLVGYQIFGQ